MDAVSSELLSSQIPCYQASVGWVLADNAAGVARRWAEEFQINTLEVRHLVSVPAFADGRLLDVATAVAAGTHVPLPLDGCSGILLLREQTACIQSAPASSNHNGEFLLRHLAGRL